MSQKVDFRVHRKKHEKGALFTSFHAFFHYITAVSKSLIFETANNRSIRLQNVLGTVKDKSA